LTGKSSQLSNTVRFGDCGTDGIFWKTWGKKLSRDAAHFSLLKGVGGGKEL